MSNSDLSRYFIRTVDILKLSKWPFLFRFLALALWHGHELLWRLSALRVERDVRQSKESFSFYIDAKVRRVATWYSLKHYSIKPRLDSFEWPLHYIRQSLTTRFKIPRVSKLFPNHTWPASLGSKCLTHSVQTWTRCFIVHVIIWNRRIVLASVWLCSIFKKISATRRPTPMYQATSTTPTWIGLTSCYTGTCTGSSCHIWPTSLSVSPSTWWQRSLSLSALDSFW